MKNDKNLQKDTNKKDANLQEIGIYISLFIF